MIGILGGTFDPIHNGHLRTALDVTEALELEQVRFIPLNIAVHRDQPATPAELRLAMVRAAVAGEPRFVADDRELKRDQPSFTLDTLRSLRTELGDEVPLCFLLGGDAFNGFLSWRQPMEVLRLAHLVVMRRPGFELAAEPALRDLVARRAGNSAADLRARPGGLIHFHTVTQLDIAARDIRARLRGDRSVRYLVPDALLEILENEPIYRENQAISGKSDDSGL